MTTWVGDLPPRTPTPDRRRGHARRPWPNDCHRQATRYALAHEDAVLVQADAGPYGLAHSWVELPEGVAYDGTSGGSYDLAAYRDRVAPIRREHRFTHAEVTAKLAATGRYADYRDQAAMINNR